MKRIPIPNNFDGSIYYEKYGEDAVSDVPGFLRVPDEIDNVDDCVTTLDEFKADKINRLWQAATDYEQTYISGSAPAKIGLLAYASNAKAVEVATWVETIWADYYSRKTSVSSCTTEDQINAVSEDFSNNGSIPYSVFEVIYGE